MNLVIILVKLSKKFKNILKEGIKTLSSGTDDYRHGAQIRPVLTGTSVEVFKKKELMSPETYRSLADK